MKNLPNILTIFRIILIPIILSLILLDTQNTNLFAFIAFIVASLSDYFDGYLARKYNLTSKKYKADNLRQITLKNYKYGGAKLKAKVRDLIKKTKKNNSSQSSSNPQSSKNIDEEEK